MKIKKEEFLYFSNILSLIRIPLVIPIFFLIQQNDTLSNILIIFVGLLLMLTDYLDGYFSRKLNQITELGKILDPVADKISMAIVLYLLIVYREFPITIVAILIYRDIIIVLLGLIITKKTKKVISSNVWGKWNTTIIAFTGLIWIISTGNYLITILVFASYAILIISSLNYYFIGERLLFSKRSHKYLFRIFIALFTFIVFTQFSKINFNKEYRVFRSDTNVENADSLLNQYAPNIYLTQDETYFPVPVESFINKSLLMKKSSFIVFDDEISSGSEINSKFNEVLSTSYYIKLNRGLFESVSGLFNEVSRELTVTVYTSAMNVYSNGTKYTVLQYWFFFWASNAGSTDILFHECDWEMVMYLLDEKSIPIKAGYSQHYYGTVRNWNDIELFNGKPNVYFSYGGHSAHFSKGNHTAFFDPHKNIPLGNDLCTNEKLLTPKEYRQVKIGESTGWINFEGYWGIPITANIEGPKYRNPKNSSLSMWSNPLAWFNKFEKKIVLGE
ncbi:CDP-alcohol phosphatidyltransferase family protein [Bacteroidota bacterium]